ncbi:MAG: phosphoribosylformylglycinamidine synthase, partial [bacterium]|nr:phosphoribosylformylglycinamidine synthase [bacterium]
MSQHITHIQLAVKDHIRDVEGEKVADSARKYLGIETGKVKNSKIFSILYELSERQIQDFAHFGLRDKVINDAYINEFHHDPQYRSYIIVAKLPGVTDDEGSSAQKTLADQLNISLD